MSLATGKNKSMQGSRRVVARRKALELVYFSFHVLTVVRPTHCCQASCHSYAYCCKAYSLYALCSLLQGIISALCLPVARLTVTRHHQCILCLPVTRYHQCPMPPCYKAHCCKASSVPYASLLQDSLLQGPLPAYLASVVCVIIAFIPCCSGLCFIPVMVWSGLCFIPRWSGLVWSGLCFIPNPRPRPRPRHGPVLFLVHELSWALLGS